MAIEKNWKLGADGFADGKKVIGLKWVFKTKYHADGST